MILLHYEKRRKHRELCHSCRCMIRGGFKVKHRSARNDVYCQDPFGITHPFAGETKIRCIDYWMRSSNKTGEKNE